MPTAKTIVARASYAIAAVAIVILLAVVLLLLGRSDPLVVVSVMTKGVFGSKGAIAETLLRFTPLAIVALGLIPSLQVNLFNIGAPGQIAMGGLFATLIALHVPAPAAVVLPLCASAACAGGALVALLPALLRARLNVNEILSTLVFNFLVLLFLQYLLTGPMQGFRANLPQSDPFPESAWIPIMIEGTRAHFGILVVPVVFVVALVLHAGRFGYRLKLLGASPSLAQQASIDERRTIVGTMCIAGAAAGIAGWLQVAGIDHRLYASIANPVGYTGLFAALVGRLNPVGVIGASFGFAALLRGGDSLQIGAEVSPEIISVLVGLIMLMMALRINVRQQAMVRR
jgi:general nucleoside transport system permease protein